MDLSLGTGVRRRPIRRTVDAHRAGDVALFLFWAMQGGLVGRRAIRLAERHDLLATAHLAMVAAVLFASATLFLLRRPAVTRGGAIGPKVVALVGTWTIIPLAALPLTWRPDWLLAGSTGGLVAAYAFVLWALLTLRRNLSIFPEARHLVRHGPYGLVRHPLYSAHVVTYALIALPRFGAAALVLVAIGITGEVLRARNEENVLRAAFPDYDGYAAHTPRFIPRLAARRAIGRPATT